MMAADRATDSEAQACKYSITAMNQCISVKYQFNVLLLLDDFQILCASSIILSIGSLFNRKSFFHVHFHPAQFVSFPFPLPSPSAACSALV